MVTLRVEAGFDYTQLDFNVYERFSAGASFAFVLPDMFGQGSLTVRSVYLTDYYYLQTGSFAALDLPSGTDSRLGALGNDLTYVNGPDGNRLATGTIGALYQDRGSDPVWSVDNISIPVATLLAAIDTVDTADDRALFASFLSGDDTIYLSGFGDNTDPRRVSGEGGNDYIVGSNGSDTILGGTGNDRILGFAGNDSLIGGDNDDTLEGGAGDDVFSGGSGTDLADFGFFFDNLTVDLSRTGAQATGAGNDTFLDIEIVYAGYGNDQLTGDAGNNVFSGAFGNDTISAGIGNDYVFGGADLDDLQGGMGEDTLQGDTGADTLRGGDGGDLLFGGTEADSLSGDAGGDYLISEDGEDTLHGGLGNDTLAGGAGADLFRVDEPGAGGAGATSAQSDTVSDLSTLDGDRIDLTALGIAELGTIQQLLVDEEADTLISLLSGGFAQTTRIIGVASPAALGAADFLFSTTVVNDLRAGTALADDLFGGLGNDSVNGNAGDDRLFGEAGNDVLNGGQGLDTLLGGAGNDTYVLDSTTDIVVETTTPTSLTDAGGIDTVQSTITFSLDASAGLRLVENLTLTGSANLGGVGNALANLLNGNSGNNTLNGGLGNDTLLGGAGNDLYVIEVATDQVFETTTTLSLIDAGGVDTVLSAVNFSLDTTAGLRFVEQLALSGTGNTTATGNALANLLNGNSGNNLLSGGIGNDTQNGGLGNDTMLGGAGNDLYVVDTAGDQVFETTTTASLVDAGGLDTVLSAVTFSLDATAGLRFVEQITLSGTADINATGNALANLLVGNTGNNLLEGGIGNDTQNGGLGNDTMLGGAGSDLYVVDALGDQVFETTATLSLIDAGGTDTVLSAVSFSLDATAALRFVEQLSLSGSGNLTGTGNALANLLSGNSGNNLLEGGLGNDTQNGGLGNDTMLGGAGNDLYVVDALGDQVFETTTALSAIDAGGLDTVLSGVNFNLDATAGLRFVENLTLSGTSGITGTGNALANLLIGNTGNNLLSGGIGNDTQNGGLGNDTMLGGAGNDLYVVDALGDQVFETTTTLSIIDAGGTDTVLSAVSFSLDATAGLRFVENLAQSGSANINATGNALANQITGNAGNNVLDGGLGNDLLNGGAGADRFVFSGNFGSDVIIGFERLVAGEVIDISALAAIVDFADLSANHLRQSGANTVITDGANIIILTGVQAASLLADDFLF